MAKIIVSVNTSNVWHPNTQMSEWNNFPEITNAKGVWLYEKSGNKMIDGVASMWCNVWGHSKKELINSITSQAKKIQHTPMFNLTNKPVEKLAKKLVKLAPGMNHVFFSDDGSTAMEISIKIALQYWKNIGEENKNKIATLQNGYHGDTFGAMSVGYVPEFFSNFKSKLFTSIQFLVPNEYRKPKNQTFIDNQNSCLEKIERTLSNDNTIAAFLMESGAQMAGGVNIFPPNFQNRINKLCKKYNVLFVLDEIATGFGRLGSMIEYESQKCNPDIVSFGKMLTGGYLTFAATLTSKKIYNSFLGDYSSMKHLFHGHTFTGNPIAANLSLTNLQLYEKYNLIQRIKKTSGIFQKRHDEFYDNELVGDVRTKGMVMGIELVQNRAKKTPLQLKKSINKIVFDIGRKNHIFFRTLGNIIMLVPPLVISEKELNFLIDGTLKTIKDISKVVR